MFALIRKKAYDTNGFETHEKIVKMIEKLANDHSDSKKGIDSRKILNQYKLFHILVGSTTRPENEPTFFDLPNGEIEAFIRSL